MLIKSETEAHLINEKTGHFWPIRSPLVKTQIPTPCSVGFVQAEKSSSLRKAPGRGQVGGVVFRSNIRNW